MLLVTGCSILGGGKKPGGTQPGRSIDAATVLARIMAAGVGATNGATQDAASDPNNLLGKPNGYTSRASFDMPGGNVDAQARDIARGGVVEVWADADAAKKRVAYIESMIKGVAALGEYDYMKGGVLVRVTKRVDPTVAGRIGKVVETLG